MLACDLKEALATDLILQKYIDIDDRRFGEAIMPSSRLIGLILISFENSRSSDWLMFAGRDWKRRERS